MTDNSSIVKKLPLIFAVVGGLMLGGSAVYLFQGSGSADGDSSDIASSAAGDAEAAIAAAGMDAKDRTATEAIVRAYLLENPEIIPEAIELLQKKQIVERLQEAGSGLTAPFPGAEAGNPKGDVTVVKFTDYNCGYCRASLSEVDQLISSDSGVRVVYREVPILAETSKTAALWALAAAKQGKYMEFHTGLFGAGRPSESVIRQVAQDIGMDIGAAEQLVASNQAATELDQNRGHMQQLGVNGTPAFVIGDQIFEGLQEYASLQEAVDAARAEAS